LKIMEGFDLNAMGHNSVDYLAHLFEAVNLSRIDTDKYVGDPDYVDVPVDRLLSDAYIAQQREKVVARVKERKSGNWKGTGQLKVSEPLAEVWDPSYQSATTSLSAADQWGNVVVITQTHGGGFGSGYVAGETGLIFNNALEWMNYAPGLANSVA